MRPLRFLLSLSTCVVAFFLVLYAGHWGASDHVDFQERGTIGAYFTWRTPSSLFPPSAIISLTDDNSTFFLARPAAFGPVLPAKSLSGQLWVGSGFGDDHLGRGGSGGGAEGELGCSDIPDWNDGKYWSGTTGRKAPDGEDTAANKKRSVDADEVDDTDDALDQPTEADGTDDHLHHPLPPSDGLKPNGAAAGKSKKPTHADIQSIQEGAEIAGKIVLLSRGGCGFLEKVKWVQRRGGVALIIGDDIRGGPLVTMYARGDTSNVTIPSLFTSHTTAHLLSSLIPSGGLFDELSAEELARLGLALAEKAKPAKAEGRKGEKPNFTTTSAVVKSTSTGKAQRKTPNSDSGTDAEEKNTAAEIQESGWLWSLVSGGSRRNGRKDSSRPPSSGNIGWVLQKDFEDEELDDSRAPGVTTTSTRAAAKATKAPSKEPTDGFVIGVQDWRDPDLVAEQKERTVKTTASTLAPAAVMTKSTKSNALKGGSITPGSGEYVKANHEAVDIGSSGRHADKVASHPQQTDDTHEAAKGWLGAIFRSRSGHLVAELVSDKPSSMESDDEYTRVQEIDFDYLRQLVEGSITHQGLWVTLTPTSMSSSPFFDTLLVLVVSPLVTLTVVYALLLLRSRIRRRRWRAPKSVVERLPVRTYQTMSSSPATSSATSTIASPVSATTPLLPSSARPISTRSRPRSRTASEVPVQQGSSMRSDDMAPPSLERVEEKRAAGLAEWRRRYGGKQRECVVCLEEYVDGVSRVMSLPCGHEFHAECITPWLTTRRRTCPICKGDVVRSLARSSYSAATTFPTSYHDSDDEDDVQEQAAATRNDDPAAAQPVSREDEAFEDLERGLDEPAETTR